MKITRVVHEISMKISWVILPKSDFGCTVLIGVSHSQPTRPQPAPRTTTARRSREAVTRARLVMFSLSEWGPGAPSTPPWCSRPRRPPRAVRGRRPPPSCGRRGRGRARREWRSTGAQWGGAAGRTTGRGVSEARRRGRRPGRRETWSARAPATGALSWTQHPRRRGFPRLRRSVLDGSGNAKWNLSHGAGTALRTTTRSERALEARELVGGRPESRRPGSAGELEQGAEQHVPAALDRLPVAGLIGAMAAPAARRDEEHARVGDRCEILRVVPGAGGH